MKFRYISDISYLIGIHNHMKSIATLFGLLIITSSYCQNNSVQFRESSFENGMLYPQVVMPGQQEHEQNINEDILNRISDLKKNDFCIGQYGYVQKSSHLQIHIFSSCIEFEGNVNRYLLYNIEEGTAVPYSDMLNNKMKKQAAQFLTETTEKWVLLNSIDAAKKNIEKINELTLDAFIVVLKKDGLDLWLKEEPNWGTKALFINWHQMKDFLKYRFI